jgi:Lysyl oxidase
VAVREVLDIGNGDTYTQARPGQSFDVTDVPNGIYYVETLANPEKKLAELTTDNNSALRRIILGGTPENRTLEVPPVHGIAG